ncbi:hypothetical protein PHYPSEUDO_012047 [Phytophthora pseudosyringae]|uniref:Uncharacterized protein n=1 Tax=Phytophthora pseudosyringae TaxID=221518 RepID=A0A8T1VAR6_9STRA|nr:hypothetical protein PHYPSEUDO_012047 [Phytophthora pseudosyringae]
MATGVDFDVEGVTTFTLRAHGSFRYRISLKSEKVNIWLEDRSSKKQWQSGLLNKEGYVSAANIFVDASAADYVSCFQQCLNCSPDHTEESKRKLTSLSGDKLQLEMSIKLRLLQSVREVRYVFKLQPVAVEQIDILESKLKDQQEELERLRGQVGSAGRAFLYAESLTWASSKLQWKLVNGEKFALNADRTSITVLFPGVYAIGALVNHQPIQNNTVGSISLQKDGLAIQSASTGAAYCNGYNGVTHSSHSTSSSLMCVVQVKKDERIAVVCTGNSPISNAASYLTAVRIGN